MKNSYSCIKDEFRILSEVKKLLVYVDGYVCENFPKSKKHLKVLLFDECKSLYMNIVRANSTEGSVKRKYQVEAMCNISFIDFTVGYMYDLGILVSRRYSSIVRLLSNIDTMVRGWSK